MEEPADNYLKNFAIMIPECPVHVLHDCMIINARGQEFKAFVEWFEKQKYQQVSLAEKKLDMWIRYNDLVIDSIGYSMQKLFDNWKANPPSKEGFTITTHTFKK